MGDRGGGGLVQHHVGPRGWVERSPYAVNGRRGGHPAKNRCSGGGMRGGERSCKKLSQRIRHRKKKQSASLEDRSLSKMGIGGDGGEVQGEGGSWGEKKTPRSANKYWRKKDWFGVGHEIRLCGPPQHASPHPIEKNEKGEGRPRWGTSFLKLAGGGGKRCN